MAAAIRCLFDKNTGCLIAYNTTKPAGDNEIVGLWDNEDYFPDYGLIYDFVTNTVKPATEEQFKNCLSKLIPSALPGVPTLIEGKVVEDKTIPVNQWFRIDYEITPDENMDPGGALVLNEHGLYTFFATWTLRGIGWVPYLLSQLRINGTPYRTFWSSGIYWGLITNTFHILLPIKTVPALVEVWSYMGKVNPHHPPPPLGPQPPGGMTKLFADNDNHSGSLHCLKLCSDWK